MPCGNRNRVKEEAFKACPLSKRVSSNLGRQGGGGSHLPFPWGYFLGPNVTWATLSVMAGFSRYFCIE